MTFGRYLLRGAAARLAVALPAATLLYLAFDVGERGPLVAERLGWAAALGASLLHLPLIAVLVLPAALLLSIALWIARLRSGGELEGAACLGQGPGRALGPLLLLGAACAIGGLAANELLVPRCEQAAARLAGEPRSALTGVAAAQPWRRAGAWLLHRAGESAPRLLAVRLDERAAIRERLEAELRAGEPLLRDARRTIFAERGFRSERRAALPLPPAWAAALAPVPRLEAQGIARLRQGLAPARAAGREQRLEALLLHSRLAFPLLSLVVAAAGAALAFGPRQRAPLVDLLHAAALLLALWALFAGGWMLCRGGLLGPAAAAWLPLGLGAALTVGILAVARLRAQNR